MKDQKTTILGILTIIATLALAGKAVLTGGWAGLDASTVIQTIIGALAGMGLIKAADSQ